MYENRLDIPLILSRLPLFQKLAPEQLAALESACRERRLAKGELLVQKGDASKGFFVVVFGQIKLAFPSSQGNEKVVEILGPHQSFGEAVMFMDRPYPVFAEGLVFAERLGIAPAQFLELVLATPARSEAAALTGPMMVAGTFSPQSRIRQHLKDVQLMLDSAHTAGQGLPLSAAHAALMRAAVAAGDGDLDNAAIVQ